MFLESEVDTGKQMGGLHLYLLTHTQMFTPRLHKIVKLLVLYIQYYILRLSQYNILIVFTVFADVQIQ